MRKMARAMAGAGLMVIGMALAGATTAPATTRVATCAPRPAGASTQPSDSNVKSHLAGFHAVEKRVQAMKGKPVDIVFIGDSITDGWTAMPTPRWDEVGGEVWAKHYADRNVLNFGLGSDRTEHVLWRLENMDVKEMRPKVAVIMIGTNNTIDTAENIAAGVKAVVDKTRRGLRRTKGDFDQHFAEQAGGRSDGGGEWVDREDSGWEGCGVV